MDHDWVVRFGLTSSRSAAFSRRVRASSAAQAKAKLLSTFDPDDKIVIVDVEPADENPLNFSFFETEAGKWTLAGLGAAAVAGLYFATKPKTASATTSCESWTVMSNQQMLGPGRYRVEIFIDPTKLSPGTFNGIPTEADFAQAVNDIVKQMPGFRIEYVGIDSFGFNGARIGPFSYPQGAGTPSDWPEPADTLPRMRVQLTSAYGIPASLEQEVVGSGASGGIGIVGIAMCQGAQVAPMVLMPSGAVSTPADPAQPLQAHATYLVSFAPNLSNPAAAFSAVGQIDQFFPAGAVPTGWPSSDSEPNRQRVVLRTTQGGQLDPSISPIIFSVG